MKSIKYVGLALIATTLLGAAPAVFADEVKKSGNTDVEVNFQEITKPDDKGSRQELIKVPTKYTFTTNFTGSDTYELIAGTVSKGTAEAPEDVYQVFDNIKNNQYGWKLTSAIQNNELNAGDTIVNVTALTLDGVDLLNGNGVIMNKDLSKADAETGTLYTRKVADNELKISIKEKTGKIKSTDKLTGVLVTTMSDVITAP